MTIDDWGLRTRGVRGGTWGLRALGGLPLALIVTAWWLPGDLELEVRPVDGGKPLLIAPLAPGERFTLRYIHSVDRSPVWEQHSADRHGNIYVEQERFVMFGAGMGHWPGHGTLTSRGPHQVIESIHKPIGSFVLRVGGEDVDHAIIWRGTTVHLSRVAAGRAVRVSAEPVSRLTRLWRGRLGLED